jgi:hypothetical protein
VRSAQEAGEQVLAVGLVLGGGVVVLGLQGGTERDAGLEEGAALTDRFERAVELDRSCTVTVSEHPVVLAAQPGHLRSDRVGGQHPGLWVPIIPSVQVRRHVRTRGGCRRVGLVADVEVVESAGIGDR